MDEKAREAVKLQQVEANYRNHTWNLRSSLGYVVTYDGKEKRRYISGMNYGDEAAEAIKSGSMKSTSREPALYLPMACFTLLSSAQKATMSWTPHNLI